MSVCFNAATLLISWDFRVFGKRYIEFSSPPTRIHRSATDWGTNNFILNFQCLYLDSRRTTLRNSVEENVFWLLYIHRESVRIVHIRTVHMDSTHVECSVQRLSHHRVISHVISLRSCIGF